MIEREIIADQVRASFCYQQRIAALFRIHRPISNRAVKSVVDLFPMKHLAGIERHRQIEIGRGNFCELHKQTSNVEHSTSNREKRVARRKIFSSFWLRHSFVIRHSDENPVGAWAILCHLRSTWTAGSRSIARFCSFILSSLFRSASAWAGRRIIWRTSPSAGDAFHGGRCSLHSWRLKQAPAHFSERPGKASATATTPTYSSRSARSLDAFSSATFSSNRITTTKSSRS